MCSRPARRSPACEAEVRILVSTKCREEAPDTLRQRVIDALRDCDPAAEPATESDA